jgi:hypothetical protein
MDYNQQTNHNQNDVGYLIGKEREYNEKARAATDNPKLQLAYEAAAREYASQAMRLKEKRTA